MRFTVLRAISALAVTLMCFSPLQACRPLALDDCPPVDKGRISSESGIASSSDGNICEITSIKYGIVRGVDIGIDMPYLLLKQSDGSYTQGIGDVTLKTKINAVDYLKSWAGLSFVVGSKLSNGDTEKGLGSGFNDYGVNAITTKTLGESLIHANIGYSITGDNSLRNSWQYGCSCDYPAMKGIHLVGEIIGGTNPDANAEGDILSTQIGLYKNIGGIVFDAGVNFGLSNASLANVYAMGLTLGF
ncbi:MAG: hypothetical protein ACYC5N_08760 [Endomicrobiales bacterium]